MSAPGVAITHADGNPPPDIPHDNVTRLGAVAIHVGWNPIQVSPPLALNVFTRILHNTLAIGPARSKRGNLGLCPRPWRGVVTDPPTHSY